MGEPLLDDHWAYELWAMGAFKEPVGAAPCFQSGWHRHFLDSGDSQLGQRVRVAAIPSTAESQPPAIELGRAGRNVVQPWIDYFAYWQCYPLAEIVDATAVQFWAIPGIDHDLAKIAAEFQERITLAEIRIARIQKRWSQYEETFDWLSRYRTLRGIWSFEVSQRRRGDRNHLISAARELMDELGLTVEKIRQGLRDTLLVLVEERYRTAEIRFTPRTELEAMLQNDVATAVEFVEVVTGDSVDLDDSFWGIPADSQRREWMPLPLALPFELDRARAEFASHALLYLDEYNRMVALPYRFSEAEVAQLVALWWPKSVALRRFALAFHRLHEHYGNRINDDNLVNLREDTPIEFFVLCAAHVERLIVERLGPKAPPDVRERVQLAVKRAAGPIRKARSATLIAAVAALQPRANLRRLPARRSNPFVESGDVALAGDPGLVPLVKAAINWQVIRNYAAHHDCLDYELVHTRWGATALEAMMVMALSVLRRSRARH